ncbi:MAG: hypothetical protein WBV74_08405, partial [Pseudonocardiaceae bacterium]
MEHRCARFSPCSPRSRWQPATATATTAVPPRRHPTARVCPDNGKRLVCFAIRQTDTVVPNLATNA